MHERDRKILQLLQQDGRITNVDLAKAVELTPSATLERVRKLEEKGLIKGYGALLDPAKLGLGLLAFIFVRADEPPGEDKVAQALSALPCVLELHHMAGEDCFLLKVRAHDTNDLHRILKHELGQFPGIRSTRTSIVLNTVKETRTLQVSDTEA